MKSAPEKPLFQPHFSHNSQFDKIMRAGMSANLSINQQRINIKHSGRLEKRFIRSNQL